MRNVKMNLDAMINEIGYKIFEDIKDIREKKYQKSYKNIACLEPGLCESDCSS